MTFLNSLARLLEVKTERRPDPLLNPLLCKLQEAHMVAYDDIHPHDVPGVVRFLENELQEPRNIWGLLRVSCGDFWTPWKD